MPPWLMWRGGATGGLVIYSWQVQSPIVPLSRSDYRQVVHTHLPLFTKQYKLDRPRMVTLSSWEGNRWHCIKQWQHTAVFMTNVTCGLCALKTGYQHLPLRSLGIWVYLTFLPWFGG